MTSTHATHSPPAGPQPTEASPAVPSPKSTRSRADRLASGLLAAMVSIYSILTAVTLLSASSAEGLYYDNVFIAQAHLSDASELSIEANINFLHDLNVYEQIKVHEISGSSPAIIEFLSGLYTAEAQASMERSGTVDEVYSEQMFSAHLRERELAMMSFEYAGAWSQRAGTYNALATVLAVGLAFAAWASLMEQTGWIRGLFIVIAFLILVASLGFLTVHLVTREPLEEYISPAGSEDQASIEQPEPASAGGHYVHPSGAFEFAVPPGWELAEEDAVSALISDGESLAGAHFASVERAATADEMRAYATDFIDTLLGDYQVDTLDAQPGVAQASVTFTSDGSTAIADFFFEQQEKVVFVFFFAAPSDTYGEMLPIRDGIGDTFQSDPEAALAANP